MKVALACKAWKHLVPPPIILQYWSGVTSSASWSDWGPMSSCQSGCITGSRGVILLSSTKYFISCSGYRKRTRTCEKKHPGTSICPGSYTDISLCDTASCSGYKLGQFILNINQHFIMKILIAASDYASDQCQAFIKADKRLESKISPLGKQNQHDTERLNIFVKNIIHIKFIMKGWCSLHNFL